MPRPTGVDPALAQALRSLRESKNLTQEDVAHSASLTVAALSRIERGQANPTWLTIRAIAGALDVGLTELARSVEQHEDR